MSHLRTLSFLVIEFSSSFMLHRSLAILLLATWLGAQAPPNDNCWNAQVLFGPGTISGTNVAATSENIPGNLCGPGAKDVWYSFIPVTNCITTVTVCSSVSNLFHRVEAFTGTCAGLTKVPGPDPCGYWGSSVSCPNTNSAQIFAAAGNVSYLIRVRDSSEGAFTLTLDCPPLPPNDACAGAIALSDGTNGGLSNVGALTDPVPTPCSPMVYDVWFTYANSSAVTWSVTLDMCPLTVSTFGSVLAVYSGTCGALSLVGCKAYGCIANNGGPSRVTFVAAPLTTYTIAVGNFWNGTSLPQPASGFFGIEVSHTTALSIPIGVPCSCCPAYPYLTTTLPIVNTLLTATLSGYGSGTQAALFVSVPTSVITPFSGCSVYLDLPTVGLIHEWTTPGNFYNPFTFSVLVPNDGNLEFAQFYIQGVVLSGSLQISNAVALTIGI